MNEAPVLLDVENHVATVTLNQPASRNAMSPEILEAFPRVLAEATANEDVRCIVVTGAGKGFCAGADFRTLPTLTAGSDLDGVLAVHGSIRKLYAAFACIGEVEIPTIAAVNGAAVGGGLGLALHCDIRFVAEEAKVGANFSRLGIHPGMGITALLQDAIGTQAAAELLFSGRLIRGREATELGLFLRALPWGEVLPAAQALAQEIAGAAPLAVRWIKKTLATCARLRVEETMATEAMAQALLAQSADATEGVSALLEKRTPRFKGS